MIYFGRIKMNDLKRPLSAQEIKSVKGRGFLQNRGTRAFSARVITGNGVINSIQIEAICKAAALFGNGKIGLTVRQTFEIQGIDFDDIEAFTEYIEKAGLKTGGTGAKVRPVVACKGTTCNHGLCDTHSLALEIHKRFYEGYGKVALPHKFKIAVGGCPNNCVKPDLNDFGLVAHRIPSFNLELCRGCTKCAAAEACHFGALSVKEGKICLDEEFCIRCGDCVGKCPFKAGESSEDIFKIYVGGKWGKKVRIGTALENLFTEEEALNLIEKAILLYKKEGAAGERFGDTLDRIGLEYSKKMLKGETLLQNKNEILCI